MFKACAIPVGIAISLVSSASETQASVSFQTIALTGEQAPGTPAGVMFGKQLGSTLLYAMSPPAINQSGQVAFTSALVGKDVVYGTGLPNNKGIWSGGQGSLGLVARQGDYVPAPYVARFNNIDFADLPLIDDIGGVLFNSVISSPGTPSIWEYTADSLKNVAIGGGPAPGIFGKSFRDFYIYGNVSRPGIRPVRSSQGHNVFWASLNRTPYNSGIWSDATGTLDYIVRGGYPAQGFDSDYVYDELEYPVINSAGQIAFRGTVAYSKTQSTSSMAIWLSEKDQIRKIAAIGDFATEAGPGIRFGGTLNRSFDNPTINDNGQVVFRSLLYSGDVTDSNNVALWSWHDGNFRLVIRKGDPAPDTEPGTVIKAFSQAPMIGRNGDITFLGSVEGPSITDFNDTGIWTERNGVLKSILKEGDPAPGMPAGTVFVRIDTSTPFTTNNHGQLAAVLTSTNGIGLWVTDRQGNLRLILKNGDQINVSNDPLIEDIRTIFSIRMSSGSSRDDGRATSFNDAGQVALQLLFSDGSEGIVVATIPEPASMMLFSAGLGIFCRRGH